MCLKQKVWLILFFCIVAGIASIRAQEQILSPDSIVTSFSHESSDAIQNTLPDRINTYIQTPDTIPTDSLSTSKDSIPRKPGMLEAPVTYQARDSIVLTAGNMAYLFGEGDVKYQQIQLQAERIEMNMDSSVVYAVYNVDSLGVEIGYPLFIDGNEQVEAKHMNYNFKTKKAYAKDVLTQQGEGFLSAGVTKKMEDNSMNMINGRYTTCDDHDHPHFYIQLTKAKARPGKNIVAGPAYLVIEDVPIYLLGLPFGFFPFTDTYSSGIIMPTYGEDATQGFFLREGGYYFALNDYADLALIGDYYTKGTWSASARSTYKKRYKYTGNFSASYQLTKWGDKGFDDYSVRKSIRINWQHQQDAKANPFRTVSARVNFSTNQYDRNEIKSQALSHTTDNTKESSVSISQRFPNSPWSLSATMTFNQNMKDSLLNVTLPNLTINMSMIAPLKRKNAIGPERWYEKIKMSYSGNLQNSIRTKQDDFLNQNLIRDWQNGMNHQIPVSATYSLFNYINITPSFNYQERWYTNKVMQRYDTDRDVIVRDTLYGFNRVYNYNASISAGTTLYGFYKPWAIFGGFLNTIRHRMEPSVSLNMSPDFGNTKYGYHQYYSYTDKNDVVIQEEYSPYRGQLFGVPGKGKTGSISFSLNNNIEAKIRSDQDSTGLKKISLIDNLSYNISYNMAADSLKWSPSNVSLRLKLSKNYTLNLTGSFDTYIYTYDEKTNTVDQVNIPRWKVGKGLGRLKSTGTNFSYTFDNNSINTIKGWFSKREQTDRLSTNQSNDYGENDSSDSNQESTTGTRLRTAPQSNSGDYDENGYYKANIPWSLNISYGMNLGYGTFNPTKMEFNYKIRHTLTFQGNIQPTSNWRISYNGSYDFERKKIPYMSMTVTRDLHCFVMSASIVPVGDRKSYMFSIAVSSSLLKDLKYNQSSNYWNGLSWY